MSEPERIGAVVLAAGRSERMEYPKPLLVFGKETAVDRVIRICMEAGCDPVVVVLGHEPDRIRRNARLKGALAVVNEDYASGQTSSLQAGLRALPEDVRAFLLFPVDHVMVRGETISALLEARRVQGRAVTVPSLGGRRGHPALCDRTLIPEILALSSEEPARAVTGRDPGRIFHLETEDAEVLRDLDTPADYLDALEVYSQRGGEAGFLAPKGAGGRPAPKKPPVP